MPRHLRVVREDGRHRGRARSTGFSRTANRFGALHLARRACGAERRARRTLQSPVRPQSVDGLPFWASGPDRAGGRDFETSLLGADLDQLLEVRTPAEVFKLAAVRFRSGWRGKTPSATCPPLPMTTSAPPRTARLRTRTNPARATPPPPSPLHHSSHHASLDHPVISDGTPHDPFRTAGGPSSPPLRSRRSSSRAPPIAVPPAHDPARIESGRAPSARPRSTRSSTPSTPMRPARSEHASPFELAVATILSAQCTDARVNMVTPELFRRYPDPEALAAARPRPTGGRHPLDRFLPQQEPQPDRHGHRPAGGARRGASPQHEGAVRASRHRPQDRQRDPRQRLRDRRGGGRRHAREAALRADALHHPGHARQDRAGT